MISMVRQTLYLTVLIGTITVAMTSCDLEVVSPGHPPENIPTALLYSRPKETFWVVCIPKRPDLQECDFYNLTGNSIAFRCNYAMSEPISQQMLKHAWLGGGRELKLNRGTTVECLEREDALFM